MTQIPYGTHANTEALSLRCAGKACTSCYIRSSQRKTLICNDLVHRASPLHEQTHRICVRVTEKQCADVFLRMFSWTK